MIYFGVPMVAAKLWSIQEAEDLLVGLWRKFLCVPSDIKSRTLGNMMNDCKKDVKEIISKRVSTITKVDDTFRMIY